MQQAGTDSTGAEMRGQNRELVPGAGKEQGAKRNAERQDGMLNCILSFPL